MKEKIVVPSAASDEMQTILARRRLLGAGVLALIAVVLLPFIFHGRSYLHEKPLQLTINNLSKADSIKEFSRPVQPIQTVLIYPHNDPRYALPSTANSVKLSTVLLNSNKHNVTSDTKVLPYDAKVKTDSGSRHRHLTKNYAGHVAAKHSLSHHIRPEPRVVPDSAASVAVGHRLKHASGSVGTKKPTKNRNDYLN
ncbi:hypothetical protein [Candidatus Ichthyocystis hellenicum]|uniref:hypothetical protein n=1 Tax=Candidatus Ichthyocystis hellenicum TaxID=1561003 RepID=UPI000B88E6EE|nr:hypothetical protein [Candidatus Ichthyocystis hellenicum]